MSGHSKWHSIRHKKGAADAKRGKIFTRHAKLVQIAAKGGADPEMNPALRLAIDNAKADNVPNANIDRAIKKGSGTGKDAEIIEEVTYEAYGPAGVAILVDCLTDNKNRSLTNVRTVISKNGGNFAESGSVSYMFEQKSVITVEIGEMSTEDVELMAIDAGAEDIETTEEGMRIIGSKESFNELRQKLKDAGLSITKAELEKIPTTTIAISDEKDAQKVLNLIDLIEEDDDVDTVWSNFDISDEIMEKIES